MNQLQKIGAGVLHAIEAPFKFASKAQAVLNDAIKDGPELKAGILQLVTLGEAVVGNGPAGDGLVTDTAVQGEAAKVFFVYLKGTFFPLIGSIYGELKGDVVADDAAVAVVTVAGAAVNSARVETDLEPGVYHVTAPGTPQLVIEAPLPGLDVSVGTAVAGVGPYPYPASGPFPGVALPVAVGLVPPGGSVAPGPVVAPFAAPAGAEVGPGLHTVIAG